VTQLYPTQTKILEGGTKNEMRIIDALFKGVSTQFGPSFVPPSKIFVWGAYTCEFDGQIGMRLTQWQCHARSLTRLAHIETRGTPGKIYAPQTKILEGRTSLSERVSPGSTFRRFVAQIEYSHP
jgi:hypothetical protein